MGKYDRRPKIDSWIGIRDLYKMVPLPRFLIKTGFFYDQF